MSLKITILGCGNSSGTPSIGNYWGACDPEEPKNFRFRCCVSVQSADTTVIIDTGPDIKHQMNKFGIHNLDAVFYTHEHSDHCAGVDDLRPLFFRNGKTMVECYGKCESVGDIAGRYDYLFKGGNSEQYYPPILKDCSFDNNKLGQVHHFRDIEFIPFEMDHGSCISLGYRFGELSYCVDMKSLDKKALEIIKGSKIWIVDGAGYNSTKNAVHANLQSIYEYNEYIQAEEVYITCLSSQMDYKTLQSELRAGFYPAYDGLVFNVV